MAIETHTGRLGIAAPSHGTWIEVQLDRIFRNLQRMREKSCSGQQVMAVVKANAYGHGLVPVAKALQDKVEFFGIASLREASLLREQGIDSPLLVFGRLFPDELHYALQKNLTLTVSSFEEARVISETAVSIGRRAPVHVKVDTGMGRFGVPYPKSFSEIVTMARFPGIQLDGIYTHFPTAEKHPDFFTESQLANFEKLIRDLEARGISFPNRHAANSAGALRFKSDVLNLIRPGIALYGIYPDASFEREIELEPALALKSRIALLKTLEPGDSVGYGREFMASSATKIAVLPVGYAQGYPFHLSGKGCVLYRGKRYKIAGRVSMDSIAVELGNVTTARVGDEMVLLGSYGEEKIRAEELAGLAQTIPYEIVTRLDPGLPRIYR